MPRTRSGARDDGAATTAAAVPHATRQQRQAQEAQGRQTRIDSVFPPSKKGGLAGVKASVDAHPAKAAAQTPATRAASRGADGPKAAADAAPSKASRRERRKPAVEYCAIWDDKETGRTWRVGDDAYIIETDDPLLLPLEEDLDLCCVCSRSDDTSSMVECVRCLGGFHTGCLRPKLKAVPEGDWLCAACVSNAPLPTRPLRTAADKFLWGEKVLGLAHIDAIVVGRASADSTGKPSVEVACRHYILPEGTHAGRQAHNTAREVYLTTKVYYEPIESLLWPAVVCKPEHMDRHDGNDVFMCEYTYNETYRRFVRRAYRKPRRGAAAGGRGACTDSGDECGASDPDWGAGSADDGASASSDGGSDAWSGGSSSDGGGGGDDEDDDADYGRARPRGRAAKRASKKPRLKPIYQFWAERGMLPGAALPKKLRGGLGAVLAPCGRQTLNRSAAASGGGSGAVDTLAGALMQTGSAGAGSIPSVPRGGAAAAFASARRALSLAAPRSLPCRDAEKARIARFLLDAVGCGGAAAAAGGATVASVPVSSPRRQQEQQRGAQSAGVMYICGIPGTGKTACVMEALSNMRARATASGTQVVVINALSLPSPTHVYTKLWERLSGQRCGPAKALAQLQANFAGSGNGAGSATATLLLVDEIDVLMTKDQSVLYNLFEWPTVVGARLSVIGISNTHDLDSRVLPRIASRLASSKLAFQPYSVEQLRTIAAARLAGCELFKDTAVDYCARKVAATSGDVRRVLELLRRALDAAEEALAAGGGAEPAGGLTGVVSNAHAIKAVKDTYSSVHMEFLRGCSVGEKLLLVALMLEMRATKKPAAPVHALHARLESHLGMLMPEARMPEGAAASLCAGLAAKGLLMSSPAWHQRHARVQFKVDPADVATAFKDDARLAAVHSQMSV